MNHNCPCGNNQEYEACCGRFITGSEFPATPEQLMRSRYTAYVKADVDYVFATMRDAALKNTDKTHTLEFANAVDEWLGLEVKSATPVDAHATTGQVDFVAKFSINGQEDQIAEHSKFKKYDDRWYYVGTMPLQASAEAKTKRNDPCPCGSGLKYKKCCIGKVS